MIEVLYILGKIILYDIPVGFIIAFPIAWKYHNHNSKLVRVGIGFFTGIVISFIMLLGGVALTSSFGSFPV